jgi:hypothetical protein
MKRKKNRLVSLCLRASMVSAACLLGASVQAQTLPDNIDISSSPNGVVALPSSVSSVFTNVFDRYTKIVAPNGQAIHLLIEDQVSDAKAVRAREVMRFFLTDAPGSQYGANKTAIANRMGNNEAALVYFNTEQSAQQAFNGPLGNANIFAQDLYSTESVVEGTNAYINNTNRDATFEEVFHLVHGAGIQPVLPGYHQEMTAAKNQAKAAGHYFPPPGLPPQDEVFEYIISVIDVYYGYWAHDPLNDGSSFWGEYVFGTRAAVIAGDPTGVNVMRKFLPEYFTAALTVTGNYSGTFTLTLNGGTEYTLKSQYLTDVSLSGSNGANLTGNAQDNRLSGNSGNNTLSGEAGTDTAVFSGAFAEYTVGGGTVVDSQPNRDGTDTLHSIEFLEFRDQTVPVDGGTSNYCIAAPNSAGPGEHISATGSTSISQNDMVLSATGGVAGSAGLFFFGTATAQAPLGDGVRCVGGFIQRLNPVQFSDAAGVTVRALDFSVQPLLDSANAGETKYFQHWYRDILGPGGTGFNASDGLAAVLIL